MAGAYIMASMEAAEYAAQNKLSHSMLATVRITSALVVVSMMKATCMTPEQQEEFSLWTLFMAMIMMAGVFAPAHRFLLWLIRTLRYPTVNRNLTWHHLGTHFYDRLWMTVMMGSEKASYIAMGAFESIVAGAAYSQLT